MEEIWKEVKNYEGIYEVSNLGRVKSLERKVTHPVNGFKNVKERILKQGTNRGGYLYVDLHKNGKRKNTKIHQLVAMAFLNHTPDGMKLVVNHIDFNRTNNRVENLEIVTNRENTNRKHLKSSSPYVGVHWDKSRNKWRALIRISGKQKHLGLFTCEIEASRAYQKALFNQERKDSYNDDNPDTRT